MAIGVVLVHGYSGMPADLAPLAASLADRFGPEQIRLDTLPGHDGASVPSYDELACVRHIGRIVNHVREQEGPVVLMGHSTGGVLLLEWLAGETWRPDLLVLAATPRRIDSSYLERWSEHRAGRGEEIAFVDLATLISTINRCGRRQLSGSFPVLLLHGEDDKLVPAATAHDWQGENFHGPVRTVVLPKAGHHLFTDRGSAMSIDVLLRAMADIEAVGATDNSEDVGELVALEGEISDFLTNHPFASRHLAGSPGVRQLLGHQTELGALALTEPIIANIEVTTHCNLTCAFCARAFRETVAESMPLERFQRILAMLPHAYRITLVGLGEPLLHPRLPELVAAAAEQGRRVGLVTNAQLLDHERGSALLEAGLAAIAFSIDAASPDMAAQLRPGTDLERVVCNICDFVQVARARSNPPALAVFTAVSTANIAHLESIVDLVAGLNVHVLMMSDLNFAENQTRSLWRNSDSEVDAQLRRAVTRAFTRKLPVLTVHGLEEFGLISRYHRYLLLPPEALRQRSTTRTWCFSPWQTIPINVRGEVTICDCQPGQVVGNLLQTPFSEIWNGQGFSSFRSRILSPEPPEACLLCPRF